MKEPVYMILITFYILSETGTFRPATGNAAVIIVQGNYVY